MKEAVVFLADGFEEVEALTPVDYLRRTHEVNVTTVAVPSPTMNDKYIVISSHKVPVIADMSFEEFKENFFDNLPDLIFCPGGMPGSKNLAENKEVVEYIKKCNKAKKIIAAICAAPATVIARAGALKDRTWTCHPSMMFEPHNYCPAEETANLLGGSVHIDDVPFVTDKNLVTGCGAGAAEQFAMELVRLLVGKGAVTKIKDATCQR